MKDDLERRRALLREDYAAVMGRPFKHFYCPILHRDDDVRLCRGHVVNRKFHGSGGQWTVQRKDVDSFYGSRFESDFLHLQERGRQDPISVLAQLGGSRRLHPKITVDGTPVEHFRPTGPVPSEFAEVVLAGPKLTAPVRLGLKISVNDMLDKQSADWNVVIEKDLRLPALVSVLKSAHLTLFRLLGYRYALSAGGHFLGYTILGEFFRAYSGQARTTVLAAARSHFVEYVNMVRPALEVPDGITGTATDRTLFLCWASSNQPWAAGVFVRTGKFVHVVLVPVFEDAECAARFLRFLKDPADRFDARYTTIGDDGWEVARDSTTMRWPGAAFE